MAGKKLVFVAVLLCIGMRCEARCTAGECPLQGWVKFGSNSCIKMYPTLMKNWAEAEAICRVIGRGSHLVRINSDEESLAIKRELDSLGLQTRYLWIGLNDIEQELNRTWVGHKYEQNMYQSIDSWFQGQTDPGSNCGCWSISNPTVWSFQRCTEQFGFVCQQPLAQL